MKHWPLVLLLPFLLTGCPDDKKPEAAIPMCYEIIPITGAPPGSPILLNKCTGDTSMLLKTMLPKVAGETTQSYTYSWYKLGNYGDNNVIAAY